MQYTYNSLLVVVLIKNIKDELEAIFKAYSKTAKDKVDKVDKTKLPKLLVKEVIRIGLYAVSTLWEPITVIAKLGLKVINLLNKNIQGISKIFQGKFPKLRTYSPQFRFLGEILLIPCIFLRLRQASVLLKTK